MFFVKCITCAIYITYIGIYSAIKCNEIMHYYSVFLHLLLSVAVLYPFNLSCICFISMLFMGSFSDNQDSCLDIKMNYYNYFSTSQ